MEKFTLTNQIKLKSSDTVLKEYTHNETQAKLVYFDNGSEEKAFAAAFKTIPSDSTGVFHILEHSVLSGSENYPISSPILYMMKNSMQTFLNAFTFQGKTVYPCASCNAKDFENLMRVYLDAVFKPKLSRDIFMREGWHIEERGDSLVVSGVVFNEMNGATSSPEQIVYDAALQTMYPDTYQAVNSGGEPKNIPDLAYEKYLDTYKEYYSAKNCVILLSGKQDLDNTFAVIDKYLCEASHADIPHEYTRQEPVVAEKEYSYGVLSEDDLKENTYLVYSYNVGDFGDEERYYGAQTLYNVLLSENSSVLKSALLKSGLMRDVQVFMTEEYQRCLSVVAVKTDKDKKEEIGKLIDDTLRSIVKEGIDKKTLRAAIAEISFDAREKLSLLPSKAVESFFGMADNVFYRLPLNSFFECDEVLQRIERAADTDYFEKLIEEIFLSNPHRTVAIVSPRVSDPANDRAELDRKVVSRFSPEERETLLKEFQEFSARMGEGDGEEAIAAMPTLKREDLKGELSYRDPEFDGKAFYTKAERNGVVYLRGYFSMKGFTEEEIMASRFLSAALPSLPAKGRSAEELARERKLAFGRIRYAMTVASRGVRDAEGYFKIASAFLEEKAEDALALLRETLTQSLFSEETIREIFAQEMSRAKLEFSQNGLAIAANRATAILSDGGKIKTLADGYDYLLFLRAYEKNLAGLAALLERTAKRLFVDDRLTTGVTGREDFRSLRPLLEKGEKAGETVFSDKSESVAYAVSSTVNYNVKVLDVSALAPFTGKHMVVSKLLSLGYLWRNVREKGNAYGTGLRASRDGVLLAYSFRDPSVKQTYDVYDGVAAYLKGGEISEKEIFGCVVSVVGDLTKPAAPEEESEKRELNLLSGVCGEDVKRSVEEAKSFTGEDAAAYVELFEAFASSKNVCTVGSSAPEEESGLFEEIINV